MSVEAELARFSPDKDMLLTVGVFDGVHLGHKHLISQLVAQAKQQSLLSGVITFRQHPREVLSPRTRLPFLTDLEERNKLLQDEGVAVIIPLTFNMESSRLSARQFLGLLKKYLHMRGLVIGPDFALGRNREGNVDNIHSLGQEMGFTVMVVPAVQINGEIVSSTAIRQALAHGDMDKVRRLASRSFSLHGRVVSGAGRGMALGFPTANLDIAEAQAIPTDGVYTTWAYINDSVYPALVNIGQNPTFGDTKRSVEVYLVDYQGDLYGHELKIDFVERLRDEQKFGTVAELKQQVAEDIKRGKVILNSEGSK